jgi:hypothetical protein
MTTKECVICGVSYTTTRINNTTCGLNKCAAAAYRKRHPERVKANRQKRRNTDEYRAKHNAYEKMRTQRSEVKEKVSKRRKENYANGGLLRRQEITDEKFGKPPMVNCAECGNEFQTTHRDREGGGSRQKYCSKSCVNKHNNKKTLSTPKGAISDRIRRSIHHYLTKNGISRNGKTFALVGFSPMDLVRHIESQFTDGMSWDNRSEWHIDHIRPVSSFNFDSTDHPDFKKCWALDNLQPLWAKDNQSKGDKWDGVVNA